MIYKVVDTEVCLEAGRTLQKLKSVSSGEEQTPTKLNWHLASHSKARKTINFKDLWTQANFPNISESSVILLKCTLTHGGR